MRPDQARHPAFLSPRLSRHLLSRSIQQTWMTHGQERPTRESAATNCPEKVVARVVAMGGRVRQEIAAPNCFEKVVATVVAMRRERRVATGAEIMVALELVMGGRVPATGGAEHPQSMRKARE